MSFLSILRSNCRIKTSTFSACRIINKPIRFASSSTEKIAEIDENKPLEYLTSKAATWKASASLTGGENEMLWYQPYVVVGSVAIFLLYFCVFREENDVDEELSKSLFDRIPGLEKQHLLQLYEHNLNNGLDVTEVENRLKEIIKLEKKTA